MNTPDTFINEFNRTLKISYYSVEKKRLQEIDY